MTGTNPALLGAIVAMGVLHLVMMVWMFSARVRGMIIARISAQKAADTRVLAAKLPDWARNPAANYNNLFEAPTYFYALTLTIAVLGMSDPVFVALAWTYVACRVAHSLIHATVNIVWWRLAAFAASWTVLGVMIVRAGLKLL